MIFVLYRAFRRVTYGSVKDSLSLGNTASLPHEAESPPGKHPMSGRALSYLGGVNCKPTSPVKIAIENLSLIPNETGSLFISLFEIEKKRFFRSRRLRGTVAVFTAGR
jgi:hypothetical protein